MMIHSMAPLTPTPKVCAMAGRAMFTIEESRVVIKAPSATSMSTTHLLACSCATPEAFGTWKRVGRCRRACVGSRAGEFASFVSSGVFAAEGASPRYIGGRMFVVLSETLPQRNQRCREGIGDHARNLERPDQRSLDAHAQGCHAQQQDLHACLLTQVARHSPDDGIDEQEEPFHQEVAGERLVPGRPGLLLWRSSKAKRAEGDTHEEDQHRYKGA